MESSLTLEGESVAVIREEPAREHPQQNAAWGLELEPLRDRIAGGVPATLLFLLGAVGLVLLITCASIANLLLARMTHRGGELGFRAALGADRLRLAGLVLKEGLVLALPGGSLGLALAWIGASFFLSPAPPGTDGEQLLVVSNSTSTGTYPTAAAIIELYRRVDEQLLSVPGVRSVAVGLVAVAPPASLLPALRSSRTDPVRSLKAE